MCLFFVYLSISVYVESNSQIPCVCKHTWPIKQILNLINISTFWFHIGAEHMCLQCVLTPCREDMDEFNLSNIALLFNTVKHTNIAHVNTFVPIL